MMKYATYDVCTDCGEECQNVVSDHGFAHEFGFEHNYMAGSNCCDAEVVENGGGHSIIRDSVHVARKDHKDGKVKKGDKYHIIVLRKWAEKADGTWAKWLDTKKVVLDVFRESVAEAMTA